MKHRRLEMSKVEKIILFLFFIILELAFLNIQTELRTMNKTLTEINYAMVEQNAILKYNPMDEK